MAITSWTNGALSALLLVETRDVCGIRVARPVGTMRPAEYGILSDRTGDGIAMIATACMKSRLFDVLSLYDVASDDADTHEFLSRLRSCGVTSFSVPRTVCRRVRLTHSFDTYMLQQHSGKTRQTLRRKERKLITSANVKIERFAGTEVSSSVLDRITAIQECSWMKRRHAAVLGQPIYRALFRKLAEAQMARVWIMVLDGQDAAFVLGAVCSGVLYYEFPAFKLEYEPLSIGQVLFQHVVQDCCAEGIHMIDLGQGDAEYKQFWSNDVHEIDRVFIGRGIRGLPSAAGLAIAWYALRNPRVKQLTKAVLSRSRLLASHVEDTPS